MSTYEEKKEHEKCSRKSEYPYFKDCKKISKISSATGKVIQGYFPVPGTPYIQSAAPPALAGNVQARYIAVHRYEPATIYFSKSIPGGLPHPVRNFLDRLGMLDNTVSEVTINGTAYQRYRQTMRKFSPEGGLQTYRTEEEERNAVCILNRQNRFMDALKSIFQQTAEGENIEQQEKQRYFQRLNDEMENLINVYYGSCGRYTKGAVASLGSDILHAAFALLRYIQIALSNEMHIEDEVHIEDDVPIEGEVPVHVPPRVLAGNAYSDIEPILERLQSQKRGNIPGNITRAFEPVYNLKVDGRRLLSMIGEEIGIRKGQAAVERTLAGFKPVTRTGCDTSAKDLSRTIQGNGDLVFATVFEHSRLRLGQEIGWNWHAACNVPLPVGGLTSDKLILEDAVGKSSYTNERANAHWFAHLYGNDETADAPQITRPVELLSEEEFGKFRQWEPVPSRCEFNQTVLAFRKGFFEVRGLSPGDAWVLMSNDGYMKVHITDKYQVAYNFWMKNPQLDIPTMDFIRTTADAVMDDLMLQELAVQAYHRKTGGEIHTRAEDIQSMREAYLGTVVDFIEEW